MDAGRTGALPAPDRGRPRRDGDARPPLSRGAVRAREPGCRPSLSRTGARGRLRDDLGFEGVIISDDMEMQAIEADYLARRRPRSPRCWPATTSSSTRTTPTSGPTSPEEIIATLKRRAELDPELRGQHRGIPTGGSWRSRRRSPPREVTPPPAIAPPRTGGHLRPTSSPDLLSCYG